MLFQRLLIITAFLIGGTFSAIADDDRRVALVLGYSNYQQLPPLENPANDATAMAQLLRDMNFEVVEGLDQTREQALAALRDFSKLVEGAEIGLVYYAGHGIQVSGRNYLVPIDAAPRVAADLAFEGIAMDDLMRQVQARTQTVLFFLDACRDNPLPTHVASAQGLSRSLESAQGLAPLSVDVGSFTSFATAPNRVAYDGEGENSPYTTALLQHLATPGLEIREAMDLVRRSVISATNGLQVPWDHSALMGPVRLLDSEGDVVAGAAPGVADADGIFWNTLQRIEVPDLREAALQIYQRAFPSGRFTQVAELQLATFEETTAATESDAQPAPKLVPAVAATNDLSDLLYWREVNHEELGAEDAKSYLDRFPNGLFADQARAKLMDQGIEVAALDQQQRSLQSIELINSGGLQLLSLPLPSVDGAADATIVDLPDGELLHPELGIVKAGQTLPLADLEVLRFEPKGDSRDDYGEFVFRADVAGGESLEWATPVAVKTHDCDLIASDALDPNRVTGGTFFFDRRFSEEDLDMWANAAVIACLQGASDHPDVERFRANLGRAYIGIERYDEALTWLQPLLEQDNPLAQNMMGMMYKKGWGVEQDYETAAPLFLAAAEAGHAGAQHDIAWAYGEGRGVQKDEGKMASWMARSASFGYHQAQYNMGRLYLWGRGVERDVEKGIDLLKAAAAQGQLRANYDLADLYERGEGFEKDEAKARQLYASAVKAPFPAAYLRLARMMLEGRGGPKDVKGAVYHMALGATSGRARTETNAKKLMDKVPDEDLTRVVQDALVAADLDPGVIDGLMGGQTKAALEAYQEQQGLDKSGDIRDAATLVTLLAPSRRI
ncbi:MAG: caspase family protein [Pseudomonadota bacterium]